MQAPSNIRLATLMALFGGLAMASDSSTPTQAFRMPAPKRKRLYPQPPCSSLKVMAAWNADVDARKAAKRARQYAARSAL